MFGPWQEYMRAFRSGRLGEEFCRYHFGISEPKYEVKSSSAKTSGVIVQVWQLLEQLDKQYVVVSYKRATRKVTRGARKGKTEFSETIEEAYRKKVKVGVIRGDQIMRIALDEKLTTYCTAKGGNIMLYGKWGVVFRIPRRCMPFCDEDNMIEDTKAYTLYAAPECTPNWRQDLQAESIEGSLFAQRPSNGDPPAEEPEETLPF